ncbi:DUF6427 family protein [Dokdonia sp. Hel_I_53]|uniref:DUF6427 family protein n=1 Tax=Dokdonia sp. Hel_I_53 TaxID=1566287 RepID=UPI00119BAEFC|nr:DUF6427 family protein [Dokdonia sp. Hel_I_53]TVZ52675.1 hypothetical protein OD90_1857 [Dokdonia sp. Hel_I_53]
MLTKFFGTAKPIAVIAVLTYMIIGFFYSNKSVFMAPFSWVELLKVFGMLLLFILAMFVLSFVAQKNDLTKRNSYRILLFGAFGLALPEALRDGSILIGGALVLIALRRVISLRSELHMERKILDATFWILLASLAVFYSWVYVIAIYLTLLIYRSNKLHMLFIPIVAICSFCTVGYAILLYYYGAPQDVIVDLPAISFDFKAYNNLQILIAIAFLIGTLLWTIWSYLREQSRASSVLKGRYAVVLTILFISFAFIMMINNKTGAEWYFILPPIVIIVSNYLENTSSLLFKESLLWLIIILPIIIHLV